MRWTGRHVKFVPLAEVARLIQSTSFIQRTILGQYSSSVRFPMNKPTGNIDCPRIPLLEDGFEPREFWRPDQLKRLQRFANIVCVRVVSPELCEIAAENATIAEINQALKHSQGSRLGDSRQSGLPRSNINRRAGHNKLAYLGRESSGIDQ